MSPPRNEPSSPAGRRPAAGEWLAIASVLLLGGVLRCAFPSNMAVEHFDEGVYASNVWFAGQTPGHYPLRQLYAPPLLPTLLEWMIVLFGSASPVPMLLNLFAGTATILVVWWSGRTWFGTAAGITAAALCAFSDFHLVYTRTALTDPLLVLWLTAAVFCLGEGHRRRDRRWLFAGGVLTGLAWWTKYNGWLPIAVQVSGVCGWMLCGGKDARRDAVWHLGGCLLSAAVAAVVIAPMFAGLSDAGGYAAVAANHRGYVVGWDGWWDGLHRHVLAHWFLEGYVNVFGAAYAVAWGLLLSVHRSGGRFTWNPRDANSPADAAVSPAVLLGLVVLACGLAAAFGTTVVLAVVTLAGFVAALRPVRNGVPSGSAASESLPRWLLAAWFLGLLVATPMYRAYPRLSLPWLAAAWLGGGAALQLLIDGLRRRAAEAGNGNPRTLPVSVALLLIGGMLFSIGNSRFPVVRVPGWQNRGGFRPIAAELARLADDDAARTSPPSTPSAAIRADDAPRFVIYVYGEPGLFHQLHRVRQQANSPPFVVAVAPVDVSRITPVKSGSAAVPTFLATGPHAHRDAAFRKQWRQSAARFRQVGGALRYRASHLVLLDELPADEAANPDLHPQFAVRVFRVQ